MTKSLAGLRFASKSRSKKGQDFFFRFLATVKSAFYTLTFICLRGRRHHKWKNSLRGAILKDSQKTFSEKRFKILT